MSRPSPAALGLIGWALLACAEPPPPLSVALIDPAGLALHRGFWRPEIGPAGATLRAPPAAAGLAVRCPDGRPPTPLPAPDARGLVRVCADGPPGVAGEIRIVRAGHPVARIPARFAPAPPPALRAIEAARRAGRVDEARRLLADPPPGEGWRFALEAARVAPPAEAAAASRAAAAAAAHRPVDAARALRLGAHRLLWAQRYVEAAALAREARVAAAAAGLPAGVALARYYQGLVDQQIGRFRAAAEHLSHAIAGVEAAGRDVDAVGFALARASLLQDRGEHAAALAALDRSRATLDRLGPRGAALRPHFAVDAGWIRLRAMQAGALSPDYPGLVRHFAAIELPPGPRRANAAANRARAALLADDLDGARSALARARAADPDAGGFSAAFVALLEIELALAEGDPRAALDRAAAAAETIAAGAAHLRWRRALLEGRARRMLGDLEGAGAAWRAGLDLIREQAAGVGAAQGRSAFYADRQALVDALVELRLAEGDPGAAFAVADEARGRVLSELTARARLDALDDAAAARWAEALSAWRRARAAFDGERFAGDGLPPEEQARWRAGRAEGRRRLRRLFDAAEAALGDGGPEIGVTLDDVRAALAPGEVLVAFDGARRGFWLSTGRLEVHPVDPADPLGPWRDRLTGAAGLIIVDGGLAAARDLPPAPDGRPWTARLPVTWLPAARLLATPPRAGARPPVVIADPTGDLPHARVEGRAVAASGARLLLGGAATASAALAAMDDARWLHFAGHGAPGAHGPWGAHLKLADGVRLTAAEVLLARAAPRVAVLSGCETARRGALSREEAWALPEVLVALGARAVLAADTVLDDAAARRFVQRFYAAGGAEAPGSAFRRAVADSLAAGDPGWRGWRLTGRP